MSDDSHEYDEEVFTTICEVHESLVLGDPLYKKGFEAGAASRDAEIAELVAALATLVRLSPTDVECNNMHHTKFDQHKYDETCHVVTRYAESRSYAQELVAKARKPK